MTPEEEGNKFEAFSAHAKPRIWIEYNNEGVKKPADNEEINIDEFVEIMGLKAKGKKLSNHPINQITWLEPLEEEMPPEEETDIESNTEMDVADDSDQTTDMDEVTPEATEVKPVAPSLPVIPPDFPDDDDDQGSGIQMTLF
jgi:topoisomerase-4 subunit A